MKLGVSTEILKSRTKKNKRQSHADAEEETGEDPPDSVDANQLDVASETRLRGLARNRRIEAALELLGYSGVVAIAFATSGKFIHYLIAGAPHHQPRTYPLILLLLLPSLFMLARTVRDAGYLIWFRVAGWPRYYAQAQSLDNTELLKGFSHAFRLYVRTRKIGVYSHLWFLWAIYVSALILRFGGLHGFTNGFITAAFVSLILLAIADLCICFEIAKASFIGNLLVDRLVVMNERANQSLISLEDARESTVAVARRFRTRLYWWFY